MHGFILQEIVWCSGTLVPTLVTWGRIELGAVDGSIEQTGVLGDGVDSQQTVQGNVQFTMIMDRLFRRLFQVIVDFHDTRLITAPVAVIWSRKDSYDHSIMLPLVAFHHKLVCSGYKVQTVNVRKLLRDILPKSIACSPW